MSVCAACRRPHASRACGKCKRIFCGLHLSGPTCDDCLVFAGESGMPLFAAPPNTGGRPARNDTAQEPGGSAPPAAHPHAPSSCEGPPTAGAGEGARIGGPGPGPDVEGDAPRHDCAEKRTGRRGPGFSSNLAREVAALVDGNLEALRAAIARHVKRDLLERERDVEALTPAELEAFGRAALRFYRRPAPKAPKNTRRRYVAADPNGGAP